jgi:hypothetical protein
MFYFVESGKVQDPIYSPEQAPLGTSNKDFLQEYVANLLQNAFKNLQEYVSPFPFLFADSTDRSYIYADFPTGFRSSSSLSGYLRSTMILISSRPICGTF